MLSRLTAGLTTAGIFSGFSTRQKRFGRRIEGSYWGVGGLHDQEVVEAFAAKNAYYGKGLGQYESVSRRFEVRRPRYPRSLAKKRRIEKELEAKGSKS